MTMYITLSILAVLSMIVGVMCIVDERRQEIKDKTP
jgi:hypothetical protein